MVRLDACEQCVRVCVRSRLYLQAIGNVREGIGDQVVQALDGLLGVARVAEVVELRRVAAPHLLGPEDAALDDVLEEVASDVGLSHSARGSSLERLRLTTQHHHDRGVPFGGTSPSRWPRPQPQRRMSLVVDEGAIIVRSTSIQSTNQINHTFETRQSEELAQTNAHQSSDLTPTERDRHMSDENERQPV